MTTTTDTKVRYIAERQKNQTRPSRSGAKNGKAGQGTRQSEREVIALGIELPRGEGIPFLKGLRKLRPDIQLLFITRIDESEKRLPRRHMPDQALPLALAREKRTKRPNFNPYISEIRPNSIIQAGELRLDPLRCEVFIGETSYRLTRTEVHLLELLMRNAGQVVTKKQITERIWGTNSKQAKANVDLYIHYLRKKTNLTSIQTIRGIGYSLADENGQK